MSFPKGSQVDFVIQEMEKRLAAKPRYSDGHVKGGLIFMGNPHDAVPRRLVFDTRLTALDKLAWQVIRLHAAENNGAVFPTYNELQLMLSQPGSIRASKETVSHVLLRLKISGWLSVCKRVRDKKGRIRGIIYMLHDEPVSGMDAMYYDPHYLKNILNACHHKNKSVRFTACEVLEAIKSDDGMRGYRTYISMAEARFSSPQNTREFTRRLKEKEGAALPGSETVPGKKQYINTSKSQGSESEHGKNISEPGKKRRSSSHGSVSENPLKSNDSHEVRKPNTYVRNFSHSENKKTYVGETPEIPEKLKSILSKKDQAQLTIQLEELPLEQRGQILGQVSREMASDRLKNPTGWMFTILKKARDGEYRATDTPEKKTVNPAPQYVEWVAPVRKKNGASPAQAARWIKQMKDDLKAAARARRA